MDAKTLEYVVTVEDPTVWTQPFTVKQEYLLQDEQANRIYYEPRCHEGNYSMGAMLLGTRLEEAGLRSGAKGPDPATRCTSGCTFGPEEDTGSAPVRKSNQSAEPRYAGAARDPSLMRLRRSRSAFPRVVRCDQFREPALFRPSLRSVGQSPL